ncbi:unnamed protein product [Heligmosomoides polygyrus]|uniref:Endo/exonuclease/phosphatase domain-containing protein n=1 Tax=Heligmosomoides polygyrus TaxID=6339 RepID=A0A3P8A6S0_HELPZ|nr:unnamed protein product [Heligmosomoides polygyrus]
MAERMTSILKDFEARQLEVDEDEQLEVVEEEQDWDPQDELTFSGGTLVSQERISVQRINDHIMSLRLDTKDGYWIIMSVYAPQTGCSEQDKDDFNLSLVEAIGSVPEGDYLSIAGDMNGHVGSGRRGVERAHGGK